MANRFNAPSVQFCNSAGAPLNAGVLTFFASLTATPQAVFSDSTLVTSRGTSVTLDSAGRAGDIFLSNLAYKVVLTDSVGNQIWTADPVSTSDFSGVAQVTAWAGNPNGNVAGTAGTQGGLPSSMVWDVTNNILYICTTSGVAAAAIWTGVNSSSATPAIPMPQGRLTPVSGTPVTTADSVGATSVFYTPYQGNLIPIFSGSSFAANTFSELTLTLVASHAANALYDVFMFNNSGVLTLVTGPAWTTTTPGSSARGAGAGTTELTRLSGVFVNNVSITGRNGANTFSIAANLATYLGTIHMDGTAGQVTCHRNFGQNRKFGIWNYYNRVPIYLKAGDGTASWTYASATIRASNNVPAAYAANTFNVGSGTAANGMVILQGVAEEELELRFIQEGAPNNALGANSQLNVGIGINSSTAITGTRGFIKSGSGAADVNLLASMVAQYLSAPALGLTNVVCVESSPQTSTSQTYFGTENSMALSGRWRG